MLKHFLLNKSRQFVNNNSKKKILKNLPYLSDFIKKSKSVGGQYSDYLKTYDNILKLKPKFVLECGSGISSYIISSALKHNYEKYGIRGKCISMENLNEYYDNIVSIFPEELKDYIEFNLSPKVTKDYLFFRGVGYKEIPKYDYDFVFIDGPNQYNNDQRLFSFDLISALVISNKAINGLIDSRLAATYVYQQVFGKDIIKFNNIYKLGIVTNLTKNRLVSGNYSKKNFEVKNKYINFKAI